MSNTTHEVGALGANPATLAERAGEHGPSVWGSTPETEGLAGRTVIVTGAGRNIGRAIALAFGDAGSNVVVNARSNKEEADEVVEAVNATNGKAIAVLGDVGDPDFDQQLVQLKIGRMQMLTEALRSYVMRVAWEHDQKISSVNPGFVMNFSQEVIQEVTKINMDIHGAAGFTMDAQANKLVRDGIIWTHLAADAVQRMKVVRRLAKTK